MTGDWITERQSGRTKTREVRPKYELLTSHVARRTFVTMCLRKGMSPEDIRAFTGHTTADMMMKYVKFDDESKREKMSILNENAQSGVETVFDHAITDDERIRLGLSTRDAYFEIFEGDTASVNAISPSSLTYEGTSKPVPSTSNGLLLINLMKFSNS